jgi:hypothetical protein
MTCMQKIKSIVLASALMLILAEVHGIYGQVPQGQILGTLTDPAGAVISGANVVLENEFTGVKQTVVTNDSGIYTFSYLDSGVYRITVEMAGFRTSVFQNIRVQVNEKKRVDVQLEVGEVTATIQVEAGAPVIETDSATIGSIVSSREVLGIPLNGREFSQLALLMPGVLPGGPAGQDVGATFSNKVQVGGTSATKNTYTLDGVDNTFNFFNGAAVNPSIDAIQEFRIDKNLFAAEFGRGGAQLHVVTKKGSNGFHGGLWEFHRNSALNAGDYNTHQQDKLLRNQFGANVGGPIIKKRAFFFFNWESQRQRKNDQRLISVLTDKMRQGDFSEFPRPVKDPLTGQPFPGNIIPRERLNPQMLDRMNALMYRANLPGITNNAFISSSTRSDWNQFLGRVDYRVSNKDDFFGRFNVQKTNGIQPALLGQEWGTLNGKEDFSFYNIGVGWTRSWSPTFLSETRFGFHAERTLVDTIQPEDVGLKEPTTTIKGFGGVAINDHLGTYLLSPPEFSHFGQQGNPIGFDFNNFEVAQNVTLFRGNHLIKTGLSVQKFDQNTVRIFTKTTYPIYIFNGLFTNVAGADLLLGDPFIAIGFLPEVLKFVDFSDWGFFVQDDWKVTSSLTLNIGLRYDLQTQPREESNLWSSFSPERRKIVLAGDTIENPKALPVLVQAYKNFFVPATQAGLPTETLVFGDHNNFAPRFGFAWRPFRDNKTSIRGGYGIFYFRPDGNIVNSQTASVPFGGRLTLVNTLPAPSFTAEDPFRGAGGQNFPPPSAFFRDAHLRTPYVQQFNLSIQHEWPGRILAEINFQDQHTLKGERSWNSNQPPPGIGAIQPRRPVPEFSFISGLFHENSSRYRAMEILVRKNSEHYTFQWSHTWAKNITAGPILDTFNRDQFRGPDGYRPHVDKFHFLVDLPFGKGMPWLNEGGIVDAVLGGWTVSGIAILHQSGAPLTISWNGDPANVGISTVRANRICSGKLNNPTPQKWFDTSCFVAPTPGTFGNSGTGILFGPASRFFDFAVYKNFRTGENKSLQFRTEMFNAFNHPNLSAPRTAANATRFGEILNKALDPRVIQFALRFNF